MTDADTGEPLYKMRGITFTIAGIIGNSNGFTDRSIGYVSEEFLHSVVGKERGNTNAAVKFNQETKIAENIERPDDEFHHLDGVCW